MMKVSAIMRKVPGMPIGDFWALLNWACKTNIKEQYQFKLNEAQLKTLSRGLSMHYQDQMPISIIVGSCEFYGREYWIRDCLMPRYTTERLLESVFNFYRVKGDYPPRILDLGCGSGVIGITCGLEWPKAHIVSMDIDHKALATAQGNQKRHRVKNMVLRHGSWYDDITGFYDLVIC